MLQSESVTISSQSCFDNILVFLEQGKKPPLLEQDYRRCRLLNVVVSVVGLTAGVVAIPFGEQNKWSTPPFLQKEMTGRDSILTTETWQVIQVYSANRTKSKLSL